MPDGCPRCWEVDSRGRALDAKSRPSSPRAPLLGAARPGPVSARRGPAPARRYIRVWDSTDLFIPKHALHEKHFQRHTFVGPLVSSPERRAAMVPQINRSSTSRQPLVVFLDPVYTGFNMFVLPKRRPGRLLSVPGVENPRSCPGRTAPPSLRPAPAPPRSAPTRLLDSDEYSAF